VVTLNANDTIVLTTDNQSAFSLPFNATIESIYVTLATWVSFTFPVSMSVYPYLQLFTAPAESNVFTPVAQTRIMPTAGFSGTVPANTTRAAFVSNIGLTLPAGTRILIGGLMQIIGSSSLAQNYYFYFTGGIALRETP
jgi:hypothetical protein